MLFNSGVFLYFFTAVYLAYRVLPHRWQNRLLLAASYFFYGFWDYRFLALILISTVVDFTAALSIEAARRAGAETAAKRWLALSIAVNLGILGFFKYFDFFAESLRSLLGLLGVSISPFTLALVLPVGISFYTFQTMSYSIDVYRGRATATCAFLDFSLFVAFFPQLMAGPIERHRRLFPQIRKRRSVSGEDLRRGGWLIFWGLFKKVFIADSLAPYTAWGVGEGGAATCFDAWLVLFAFVGVRFYCDFSGYSDMAIGLASLLGFRLSRNFNLPYFASNGGDLWRRWHITLTTWIRDYVYAPLARLSSARAGRHAAVVAAMIVMGLWHGAGWNFAVFGAAWGGVIVAHRLARPLIVRLVTSAPFLDPVLTTSGTALTFTLWLVLGCFFVAPSFSRANELITLMMSGSAFSAHSMRDLWTVGFYSAPLVVMQVAQKRTGKMELVLDLPLPARALVYFLLTCLLVGAGAEGDLEFLYFQF